MKNQNKPENDFFFKKLEELIAIVPKDVSLFLLAKEREVEGPRMIICCDATKGDLEKMFAAAITEAPQIRQNIEMALLFSKVKTDPFSALKDFFSSNSFK